LTEIPVCSCPPLRIGVSHPDRVFVYAIASAARHPVGHEMAEKLADRESIQRWGGLRYRSHVFDFLDRPPRHAADSTLASEGIAMGGSARVATA